MGTRTISSRKYYVNNKEKIFKRVKEYYRKNRDKILKKMKDYKNRIILDPVLHKREKEWRKKYYKKNHTEKLNYYKKYRQEESERIKGYRKNPKNKEYQRDYFLKYNHGISNQEYTNLLKNQSGLCAICKSKNKNGKLLVVDHDHKSGKIRELLCSNCNTSLGLLKESIPVLKNMVKYIKKHK